MTEIHLPADVAGQLRAACEVAYPREACGLLLGRCEPRHVSRVVPAGNLDPRHDRFLLDPVDFVRADGEALEAGIEIVGVFHSHPDEPDRPSADDVAGAQPEWSHVIVSVRGDGRVGRAAGTRSWRLVDEAIGRRLVEESLVGG